MTGSHEVRGSIPLGSTKSGINYGHSSRGPSFYVAGLPSSSKQHFPSRTLRNELSSPNFRNSSRGNPMMDLSVLRQRQVYFQQGTEAGERRSATLGSQQSAEGEDHA